MYVIIVESTLYSSSSVGGIFFVHGGPMSVAFMGVTLAFTSPRTYIQAFV